MLESSRGQARDRTPAYSHLLGSWVAAIGLAAGVGIVYFLAARLSLALLTTPDGVAAFWPAAGLAAGTIVALGSPARVPVATGVVAATILANLTGDRNLPAAIVFAACNAGEALLIAWLIERRHGPGFSLDTLPRVLGFFLAAGIATAVSAVGAAGFAMFHSSDAPVLTAWLHWFASDAFGVVAVAPLVIGIVRSLRDLPDLSQVVEGACILAVLGVASVFGFAWPTDHWFTILPLAILLPLLVWPAARCPPVFAAAAIFIFALAIVATATLGVGRLGNPEVELNPAIANREGSLPMTDYPADAGKGFLSRDDKHEPGSKRPEFTGKISIHGTEYRLAAWVREKDGKRYFSLSAREIEQRAPEQQQRQQPAPQQNAYAAAGTKRPPAGGPTFRDDAIPFAPEVR